LVKATYYEKNGVKYNKKVSSADGKLEGKWISYDSTK
jgi:hypothetical protein